MAVTGCSDTISQPEFTRYYSPFPLGRAEPSRPWSPGRHCYADGGVLENVGEQTAEEAKLGFANFSGLPPSEATDEIDRFAEAHYAEEERLIASGLSPQEASARMQQNGRSAFPDESNVVDLAVLWSVDPTQLSDRDQPLGLGLAARMPENLRQ